MTIECLSVLVTIPSETANVPFSFRPETQDHSFPIWISRCPCAHRGSSSLALRADHRIARPASPSAMVRRREAWDICPLGTLLCPRLGSNGALGARFRVAGLYHP